MQFFRGLRCALTGRDDTAWHECWWLPNGVRLLDGSTFNRWWDSGENIYFRRRLPDGSWQYRRGSQAEAQEVLGRIADRCA